MKRDIDFEIVNDMVGTDIPSPSYATTGSAGLDLRACLTSELTLIPRAKPVLVGTGIRLVLKSSAYAGLLMPRSGLAHKHGIVLSNCVGLIDSDYDQEIFASLRNLGTAPYTVKPGDKIAQLVITPVAIMVRGLTENTANRDGGFGSTGDN